MKANSRRRAFTILFAAAAVAMLPCCVPPPPQQSPPQPVSIPQPAPEATRSAMPDDWRDAPATAGDWRWSTSGGGSQAVFAPHFVMRCEPLAGTITLIRGGPSSQPQSTMTISTQTGTRTLPARATPQGIAAVLPARDPLLDAMAFSRGRFAVSVPGTDTLFLPSWAEVSRVIEDCR